MVNYPFQWLSKTILIAFDEGRTLPNLLGCLLWRRFPVHASESWPVFFRSMVHLFGAILNDVTTSLRKAFCLVLRCLSDVLEGSSFIILPRLRHKQLSYGNHVHHWFHQGQQARWLHGNIWVRLKNELWSCFLSGFYRWTDDSATPFSVNAVQIELELRRNTQIKTR